LNEETEAFIAAAAVPTASATEETVDDAEVDDRTDTEDARDDERIPIELMPRDEKKLIDDGEELWRRAAAVEAKRVELTVEEMADHEAMDVDM